MSGTRMTLLVVAVAAVAGTAAYVAGVHAGRSEALAAVTQPAAQAPIARSSAPAPQRLAISDTPQPVQLQVPLPFTPGPGQGPQQFREFVPLPMPGDQMPGQRPGTQQGECEPIILFYHDGQLYQLMPGPGPQPGPGRPGVPPEFYRLQPYQGPPVPGLPAPPGRGPGFTPINPRS